MADLCAMDLVPEPPIVAAALRACRRVNDYSLTTRYTGIIGAGWYVPWPLPEGIFMWMTCLLFSCRILETIKVKCGANEATIWPYVLQVK